MANTTVKSQSSTLHMTISAISKLTTTWSPEIVIHGIPWKVKVYKYNDKNSLAVFLYCTKQDDSSTWTVPAQAAIQLIPFSKEKIGHLLQFAPHVYESSSNYGYLSFIRWDALLKDENKYVQDDSIELKIEITVENPNYVDRSILKFESIDKSCDCGSVATFRLTVTNIKNLMVVRSPQFIVRNLTWYLEVYKDQASNFVVKVILKKSSEKVAYQITMTGKLLSSKNDMFSIKRSDTYKVQGLSDSMRMRNIASWEEILNPENGFVNNGSIALEVELKVDKPEGDVPDVGQCSAAKRRRFECSICLEDIDGQDVSTTPCFHVFCTVCIADVAKAQGVCPLCKEPLQLNDLQRLYLSAAK